MPNITVYLPEHEYVKLFNRAKHKHMTTTALAAFIIKKALKDE